MKQITSLLNIANKYLFVIMDGMALLNTIRLKTNNLVSCLIILLEFSFANVSADIP